MAVDNSRFLDQVKMKAALPGGRYTDAEILAIAYDVLVAEVQPFIITMREEYYVRSARSALVADQSRYPIDTRALGLVLREVKVERADGSILDLPRMDPEDVESTSTGTPEAFYLQGGDIVLYPTPDTASGTLVQYFFQRISRPVEVSDAAVITNINTSSGVITATVPTDWATSDTFDLVSARNGHETLARDLTASAVTASTSITFAVNDLPSGLAVGDYVCLAQESPFIQVPDEAQPLVQQLTVCELLESLGSLNELGAAQAKAEKLYTSLTRILSNRVQGAPRRFRPQI